MNNHYHLIASTPRANISQCMQYFNLATSKRLAEAGNRDNETYAGRHYKTVLHSHNYYLNAYKYIYRNPIKARIVERAELYPFSTLYGLLGQRKTIIPVIEDITLFSDPESCLRWLNLAPNVEVEEAVRYALKRPYFMSKKKQSNGKPIIGPNDTM